jgi:hypothetical protein
MPVSTSLAFGLGGALNAGTGGAAFTDPFLSVLSPLLALDGEIVPAPAPASFSSVAAFPLAVGASMGGAALPSSFACAALITDLISGIMISNFAFSKN